MFYISNSQLVYTAFHPWFLRALRLLMLSFCTALDARTFAKISLSSAKISSLSHSACSPKNRSGKGTENCRAKFLRKDKLGCFRPFSIWQRYVRLTFSLSAKEPCPSPSAVRISLIICPVFITWIIHMIAKEKEELITPTV